VKAPSNIQAEKFSERGIDLLNEIRDLNGYAPDVHLRRNRRTRY
jgi:hypothetical protein